MALVDVVPRLRAKRYDLSHLALVPQETALGPLQRAEALVLHALVRAVQPAVGTVEPFRRGCAGRARVRARAAAPRRGGPRCAG